MEYKRKATLQPKLRKSISEVEVEDENTDENINQLIKADQEIDSVFLNLVNRLQFYNKKSDELIESICNLEEQASKGKNTQYITARMQSQKKQKQMIDKQIQVLEIYMREMINESSKFKKERDKILEAYYQQKLKEDTPNGESEEEAKQDLDESMAEIDAKLKEIEEFNNRNYNIDDEFLELYEDMFEKYDSEITSAPYQEYTEYNLPHYYPLHGIWFNSEDVGVSKNLDEESIEELKELEEEKSNKSKDSKNKIIEKKPAQSKPEVKSPSKKK